VDAVCQRGLADWVDEVEVAWVAMYAGGAKEPDDIKSLAIEVIAALVKDELMRVGDVIENVGFQPWELDHAAAVERVQREWNALDRRPYMGEICWLENTAAGAARAHATPVIEPPPLVVKVDLPRAQALPPRRPRRS
jgi:hypothetical protein